MNNWNLKNSVRSIKTKSSTMTQHNTTCQCGCSSNQSSLMSPFHMLALVCSTSESIHLLLFFGLFHFRSYRIFSSKWNAMIVFSFISSDKGIWILRCSFDVLSCFAFETSTSIVTSAKWKLMWDRVWKNITPFD